jgi:hypothetical protein
MAIWRMRIARWIPKATNTHSRYVILIAYSTATTVARTRPRVTSSLRWLYCVISGFRREINDNRALLGHYAARGVDSLQKSVNNLSAPTSGVKQLGPTGCPEISDRNYQYSLYNDPE